MMIVDPTNRIDAAQAQEMWSTIRGSLYTITRLRRLQPCEEFWLESLVLDGFAFLGRGIRTSQAVLSWLDDLQG